MSDNAVGNQGSLGQNDCDILCEKQMPFIGRNEKATTKGGKKVQIKQDSSNSFEDDQVIKDKEFESPVEKYRQMTRRQNRKESRTSVAANYYSKMNKIEGIHFGYMSRASAKQDPLLQSLTEIKDKVALNDKQNGGKEANGESPNWKMMEQKASPLVLKKYQSSTTKQDRNEPNKVSGRSKMIKKPSSSSINQNDEIQHKTGKQPSQSVQKNLKKQCSKHDNRVIIDCGPDILIEDKQKDMNVKHNGTLKQSPQIKPDRKKKAKAAKVGQKVQKNKSKVWKSPDERSQSAYSQHLKEALKQKMRQQQYQKALKQSGRSVLKNLITRHKMKQAPENFGKDDMMFESRELENNFASFMKVIKFKHQKSSILYQRREFQDIGEEEYQSVIEEEENVECQELDNEVINQETEPVEKFQISQTYTIPQMKQIQQNAMEMLKIQVQSLLCGLSLNDLKPECITQELCHQIVSLLEGEAENKCKIHSLKRYFYQKEFIRFSTLLENKSLEMYHKVIETIQNYEEKKRTKMNNTRTKQSFVELDPHLLSDELEVLNARNTLKDLEEKFALARNSIITLVLQDYKQQGEFKSEAEKEMQPVNPLLIEEEQRESIGRENPFFEDMYNIINSIITEEGIQFSQFKDKINTEFPENLELYDKFIRQKTSAYTIELGKIQEAPKEEHGAALQQKLDDMLSKYGVTMHSLLFKCDQALQQAIIQGFCDQDKELFQQEIRNFDTNVKSFLQNDHEENLMKETQERILEDINQLQKLQQEVENPSQPRCSKISINLGENNEEPQKPPKELLQNLLMEKIEELNGQQVAQTGSNEKNGPQKKNFEEVQANGSQNGQKENEWALVEGQDKAMIDNMRLGMFDTMQQLQQHLEQQQEQAMRPGTSVYYDQEAKELVEVIEVEQDIYDRFMEGDHQQQEAGIQNVLLALQEAPKYPESSKAPDAKGHLVKTIETKQEGFEQHHVAHNPNDSPLPKQLVPEKQENEEQTVFPFSGSCRRHIEICKQILQTRTNEREGSQLGQNISQENKQKFILQQLQPSNITNLNDTQLQYQQAAFQQVIGEDGQMYLIALQTEPEMQLQYEQTEEEQLQIKTEQQIRIENDQVQNQLQAQQNEQMKTQQELMQMQLNSSNFAEPILLEQQQNVNPNQPLIVNQQQNPLHQLNSPAKVEFKEDNGIQGQKDLLMTMQNCIVNNQQLEGNDMNGLLPVDIQQQVNTLQQLQQSTQNQQFEEQQQQQPEQKQSIENVVPDVQTIQQAEEENCEEIQVITEDQNGLQQVITLKNQQELAQYIEQIQQQQNEEEQLQLQVVELNDQQTQNNMDYYNNAQELNNHIKTQIQNLSNQLNIQNRHSIIQVQSNHQQDQVLPELLTTGMNEQQVENEQEQMPNIGEALTMEQIQQQTDIEAQLQQQLNQLQQQQVSGEGNHNMLDSLANLHQFTQKEQNEIIQALQQQQQQLEAQNQPNQQNPAQITLPPSLLQQQQLQQKPQIQNQPMQQNLLQQPTQLQPNLMEQNQQNHKLGYQTFQSQLTQQLQQYDGSLCNENIPGKLQQQQINQHFQQNEQTQALLQQQLQAQAQACQVQQQVDQHNQQAQTQMITHAVQQQNQPQVQLNPQFQAGPQQIEEQHHMEGNHSSLTVNQQNQLLMQRMQYMYRNNNK